MLSRKSVFLSYSSADKQFVCRLAESLEKCGIPVWLDEWEIAVGDSIVERVDKALSDIDCIIPVLSPNALESAWMRRELNASLMRALSHRSLGVFPVLYIQCQIPAIIADLKYADFRSDFASGFSQLIGGLAGAKRIPAHLLPAKSFLTAYQCGDEQSIRKAFPFSLSSFPRCLMTDGRLDIAIILGSTERERSDETAIFAQADVELEVLGHHWSFTRQVAPGSVRNVVRATDLAAFLGFYLARTTTSSDIVWPDGTDSICVMDVSVSSEMLERNLILVGGADTNIYVAIATAAFRQRFGMNLPIRFRGDEHLYFTCDQIFSEASGKTYPRVEDAAFMHCGYVLMASNPWAPSKVMIFAVGTRATGTQAALLALIRGKDCNLTEKGQSEPWHRLSSNNRYCPTLPGKVVRARDAVVIDGPSYIHPRKDIRVSDDSRFSQRHIVTGFEFLE